MTAQELVVWAVGLVALGYVVHRYVIRRRASTCCGEARCPATTPLPGPSSRSPAPSCEDGQL